MKRSRVLISASAFVAVAVVAVVAGLWWKPWQSAVALPKSACWGVLGQDDIRPVVGSDGTVTEKSVGSLVSPGMLAPTGPSNNPMSSCVVSWNGGVAVQTSIFAAQSGQPEVLAGAARVKLMTLAPGIMLVPGSASGTVFFQCDRFRPYDAYAALTAADGDHKSGSVSEAARSGYANIALKLAKAEAAGLHCNNPLNFPASVPTLPPVQQN